MYLDFYGFTEKPFSITPNPRFIFFSSIHREAFALLLYGINSHAGFMELVGEVGTGKTTVLRTLLGQLDEESCRTALILNPPQSAADLLSAVNREFGIPAEPADVAGLLDQLNRFLLRENSAGRTVLLIIDEAQNLAPEVLEQIRLISNLETDTDKLIQIVLAGQPELARMLELPELRQLNQRIALRYRLRPLGRDEANAYIKHRLDTAGGRGKASFTPWALRLIHRFSRGTPRLINMLCDRALLIGYTEDRRRITGRIATLAWRDITLKSPRTLRPRLLAGSVAFALLLLFALWGYPLLQVRTGSPGNREAIPPAAARETGILPNVTSAGGQLDPSALKKGVLAELSVRSEEKSAIQAFNAVAERWHAPPLLQLNRRQSIMKGLRREANKRDLVLTPFSGDLDEVARVGLPALLPLAAPHDSAAYLVAMAGTRNGRLQVYPPLLGRTSFSRGEFLPLWSGKAYLVWRNFDRIPSVMGKGVHGAAVRRLQALLRKAGASELKPDGIFEAATVGAIEAFQASRGITATGKIDPLTLILLYKAAHYPGIPDSLT